MTPGSPETALPAALASKGWKKGAYRAQWGEPRRVRGLVRAMAARNADGGLPKLLWRRHVVRAALGAVSVSGSAARVCVRVL